MRLPGANIRFSLVGSSDILQFTDKTVFLMNIRKKLIASAG
jgi:hypothetical protein